MAHVRPFRALRYDEANAGPLAALVAPPYDVIGDDERQALLGSSAHNACHLILPEVPYEQVRALLDRWTGDGVLRRDEAPVLIAWTQHFALADGVARERRTLLGAVGLEPYEARVVRPHERTHDGPREDRLRLTRQVRTNLSPVFGLYPDPQGAVWAAAGVDGPPYAELTDPDGTVHRFHVVDDPAAAEAVAAALADRWILIADGHHRYETALAYRDERRAADGPGPERAYDRVLMGLTALDDPGLVVLPTHRLLARWPGGPIDGLAARPVDGPDALVEALAAAPGEAPAFGLLRPDGVDLVVGEPDPSATPAQRLDVAVLEQRVLVPHLGADQARLAHDGQLEYTKDAGEAAAAVTSGRIGAAVIMRPIPKPAVAAVADAGETMPQKSTYFFPKLLTGVAFNPLDD